MKPAFSVILFTVLSGAGYGLILLAVLFDLFGLGGGPPRAELLRAGGLGIVLVTIGLAASTAHLHNPRNAWRSFVRFKTSWLSREAVFAVLTYPFLLVWLWGVYAGDESVTLWGRLAGAVTVLLGVATVFATGMIYASLKTIRQWHTPLVPVNYLAQAFSTGILLFYALTLDALAPVPAMLALAAALVVLAAAGKAVYYFWVARPAGPSIGTATGFTRDRVGLLDPGHGFGTFLTEEFGFQPPSGRLPLLKAGVFILGFLLPLLLMGPAADAPGGAAMWIAALSALVGAAMERWLFFAEARHVVNLYHGARTT